MRSVTGDGWELDALTVQVWFWEGSKHSIEQASRPMAPSKGNRWETEKGSRMLNSKDFVLLTRSGGGLGIAKWMVNSRRPVISNVRR